MKFISGNQAIVQAAIDVGAKFFSGYPITPASEIMEEWAQQSAADKDLKFIQSEDELAALHQALGAVIGGTPGFSATSGPGLSLMQEGLGLAFAYQAPLVVVDVMRSGPSTGAPTRAGQGEILASRFGTHGDVYPFVFYPSSVAECYFYTVKAFQIAWKHKVPVIVLSDAYLAHLREQLKVKSENFKINHQSSGINHYKGLITRKENAKKINKLKKIAEKKYRDYNLVGNQNSDTLLIGLGSMARALYAFEKEYQIFNPIRVWPMLDKEIKQIAQKKKKIIVVEMNRGQYVRSVRQTLDQPVEFVSYQEQTIDLNNLKKEIDGK